MTRRILIDAAHPEEIRVALEDDGRLEEFDFETENRQQIKSNIYLGKITRVEPSLQAVFVEYGGNRQGFLPFSEIHYNYYQIPVADRKKLEEQLAELDRQAEERQRARDKQEEVAANQSQGYGEEELSEEILDLAESKPDAEQPEGAPRGRRKPEAMAAEKDDVKITVNLEEAKPKKAAPRRKAGASKAKKEDAAADEGASQEVQPEIDEKKEEKKTRAAPKRGRKKAEKPAEPEAQPQQPAEAETAMARQESAPAQEDQAEQSPETQGEEGSSGRRERSGRRSRQWDRKKRGGRKEADRDRESSEGFDEVTDIAPRDDDDEAAEARVQGRYSLYKNYKVQEVIKRNQILLVQVIKEERGNKGASLTTYVSLAGRCCVLMPNTERAGGVSRRITDFRERKRLKSVVAEMELPKGSSLIVRTAGVGKEKDDLLRDYDYLLTLWDGIKKQTVSSTAPALIHEEGSLIKRVLRDMYRDNVDEIVIEGEEAFRSAEQFVKVMAPNHINKLKLYKEPDPVFDHYGIERQLEKLYSREVALPSGGSIVIVQTEALVAIDVNSGRATSERNIEDTALSTNLEAAREISRQLRLRDLAGLVVIDFIDMRDFKNRRTVERALKDALRNDRAKIQVGRISMFGLLEMSRQRLRSSIIESSTRVCPSCMGSGYVRSEESITLSVLRAIEAEAVSDRHEGKISVRVPVDVAMYLLNKKREDIQTIEERAGIAIEIIHDFSLTGAEYEIDRAGGFRHRRQENNRGDRDRDRNNNRKNRRRGRNRGERDRDDRGGERGERGDRGGRNRDDRERGDRNRNERPSYKAETSVSGEGEKPAAEPKRFPREEEAGVSEKAYPVPAPEPANDVREERRQSAPARERHAEARSPAPETLEQDFDASRDDTSKLKGLWRRITQ